MVKYGLAPGTLKGELFRILSQQGNNGLRVSELARSVQVVVNLLLKLYSPFIYISIVLFLSFTLVKLTTISWYVII